MDRTSRKPRLPYPTPRLVDRFRASKCGIVRHVPRLGRTSASVRARRMAFDMKVWSRASLAETGLLGAGGEYGRSSSKSSRFSANPSVRSSSAHRPRFDLRGESRRSETLYLENLSAGRFAERTRTELRQRKRLLKSLFNVNALILSMVVTVCG